MRSRAMDQRHRSIVVHLVGQPATGKTHLAYHFDNALGIPFASVDAERQRLGVPLGADLAAWVALEDRLDATSPVTCETAGTTPNDGPLLVGRQVYRVRCVAALPIRDQRLRQRPGYDAATVARLLDSTDTALPVDYVWDSTDPDPVALARIAEAVEAWARAAMSTRG